MKLRRAKDFAVPPIFSAQLFSYDIYPEVEYTPGHALNRLLVQGPASLLLNAAFTIPMNNNPQLSDDLIYPQK